MSIDIASSMANATKPIITNSVNAALTQLDYISSQLSLAIMNSNKILLAKNKQLAVLKAKSKLENIEFGETINQTIQNLFTLTANEIFTQFSDKNSDLRTTIVKAAFSTDASKKGYQSPRQYTSMAIGQFLKDFQSSNKNAGYASDSIIDDINEAEITSLLLKNLTIAQEAYSTLNLITETIRGKKVTYQITYIDEEHSEDIYTIQLNLEQFLHYMTINKDGRLRLDTTQIQKDIQDSTAKGIKFNNINKWSNQRVTAYNTLVDTVQNLQREQKIWKNSRDDYINRGNIVEAFRFVESIIKRRKSLNKIFANETVVSEVMKYILKNNASFLTGGDVDIGNLDVQLKNINASITSLNSLLNLTSTLKKELYNYTNKSLNELKNILKSTGVNEKIQEAKEKAKQSVLEFAGLSI